MDSIDVEAGDRVRTIRDSVETVVSVIFPMVYTDKAHANMPGGGYHHSKVFKIARAAADPQKQN